MRRSTLGLLVLLGALTLAVAGAVVWGGAFTAQGTPDAGKPPLTPDTVAEREQETPLSPSATSQPALPESTPTADPPAEEDGLDCDARPVRMSMPQGDSGVINYATPASFDELVEQADLIVVARLDGLVRLGHYAGYDDDGNLIEIGGMGSLPFYDYQLKIEQVISAHAEFDPSAPVIVRTTFQADPVPRNSPRAFYIPLAESAQYLLFLGLNPDQKAYGITFVAGQLLVGDGPLYFSDGARTRLALNRQPATLENIQPCIAALEQP